MTAHANPLTEGVKKRPGPPGSAWSAPAGELRVLLNAFGRLGYDVGKLVASSGLQDVNLDDPDVRVPCEAYGAVIARAKEERDVPNLALELARLTPIGTYPLLDYLVLTSDTVGTGVRQLAHYFRLVGNPLVLHPYEDDDPIRVEVAAPSQFSIEYAVSLLVLHFRTETDGRFAAAAVHFEHAPDNAAGFEDILGCPVRPKSAWSGVSVPLEVWRLPLRRRDPVLRQVLESQANEILARLPARTGLALEVQRLLAARVAGGDTRIGALARQLAMSARTVQRRLSVEGVSYQQLLDDTRKEAAGRHISQSTLAICEVAYLLGYSEPAPFHRAFKRWYGVTPDIFRQRTR